MKRTSANGTIHWKDWTKEAFDEAERHRKLVLLDLTASWCHWCHVMDDSTYSDPGIAQAINQSFVPIRVDIDRRPDISERYNRGGFPTTAFLSDRGESIWGATYVPPADMKRIIIAIQRAKESGEIDQALERSRMHFLDLSKTLEKGTPPNGGQLLSIFEDIFAAYDVEFGGFGIEPKFPHPAVIELLLSRYAENNDDEIADAVTNTLQQMTDGLYDKVAGGVFRYSVTRDWHTPHYEKMLETNIGYLRNLVHAFKLLGRKEYADFALGTARYLMKTLQDPKSGGFYGSQDADEQYYKLSAKERAGRKEPSVDRNIYAGWNSEASSTLTLVGTLLGAPEITEAGQGVWRYVLENLWDPKFGLVRHAATEDIHLFDDQVTFFEALISQLEVSRNDDLIELAEALIRGADRAFTNEEGGYSDVMKIEGAIGELDSPRRPLVENSRWALALTLYGTAVHKQEMLDKARAILDSYTQKEVEAHGVFGATYLKASWALDHGPVLIEVRSRQEDSGTAMLLWTAAKSLFDPATVAVRVEDSKASGPFAIICTKEGCSKKIIEPDDIIAALKSDLKRRAQ